MSRDLLTSLLFKFSPSTQEIKKSTLSKIILNLLFLNDKYISNVEIHKMISNPPYNIGLTITQCKRALDRLEKDDEIKRNSEGKFGLTKKSLKKIEKGKKDFEDKLQLLERFISRYKVDLDNFLQTIHHVFSQLGQQTIDLISGSKEPANFDYSLIRLTINSNLKEGQDKNNLNDAVLGFIKDNDPQINEVKWLLAQNSFLFRLIGSDVDESNFSKEYFKGARFYLDTNVLLNAIEPNTKHHETYNLIIREVKKYDTDIYVFEQNIKELEDVLNYKHDILLEILESCPGKAIEKADSFLSEYLKKQINDDGEINVSKIFARYSNIAEWARQNKINVNNINDTYGLDEQKVEIIRERVKQAYKNKHNDAIKHDAQAIIDARLLLAALTVKRMHNKTWVLTLDTTLPEVTLEDGEEPLVLTIDALLQWLSVGFVEKETDYAKIFSNVLTERLLPSERFFKLEDFKIFSSLEKDVKELPEGDVIGCLEHIRENVGSYNLSNAEDRERLHYEIDKYFKRSGLEYKENLIKLNEEVESQKAENLKTKNRFDEYKSNTEKRIKKLEKERDTIQSNYSDLEDEFKDLKATFIRLGKSIAFFFLTLLGLNILIFLILNLINEGYYEELSILEVESYLFFISLLAAILYDLRNHKLISKIKELIP